MLGKNLAKSGKREKRKKEKKKKKKRGEEKNGVYMCWCMSMTPNQRRSRV
jgi:hypothetical protein